MTKKIRCQANSAIIALPVKIRVIKAPIVNTQDLRNVVASRAKALVL